MIYYFLAELVLVFHFCFVLFVVLGQLLALRWPSAGASLNLRGVAKVCVDTRRHQVAKIVHCGLPQEPF